MKFEVGVVVPTYNRAALVGETLASVLAQSHEPAQVIVIDDGSMDETASVVGHFGPRVRYHRIENSGENRARNAGVALTTTPWIAFCDDDDLWRPGYLASHRRLFEFAPDIDYAFSNFVHVREGTWETATKFEMAPPGFWDLPRRELDFEAWILTEPLYERILQFQPIFAGSTVVMRRDFFESIGGFDDSFGRRPGEDLEFILRCVQNSPIGCLREPHVGIRKHASNLSGDELEVTLGAIAVLRHALDHHFGARQCRNTIDRQIRLRNMAAAELAFGAGDLELVRRLCATVPRDRRSVKLRIKHFVSCLPGPLAKAATSSLLALSAARTRLR